jgi:hypothetical protein
MKRASSKTWKERKTADWREREKAIVCLACSKKGRSSGDADRTGRKNESPPKGERKKVLLFISPPKNGLSKSASLESAKRGDWWKLM